MNEVNIIFDWRILLPFAFEIRAVALAIGITAWFHFHNMATCAPAKSSMLVAFLIPIICGCSIALIIGGIFGNYELIMYSSLVAVCFIIFLWLYLWQNGMHVNEVLEKIPVNEKNTPQEASSAHPQ
jgi:hypothetical protein